MQKCLRLSRDTAYALIIRGWVARSSISITSFFFIKLYVIEQPLHLNWVFQITCIICLVLRRLIYVRLFCLQYKTKSRPKRSTIVSAHFTTSIIVNYPIVPRYKLNHRASFKTVKKGVSSFSLSMPYIIFAVDNKERLINWKLIETESCLIIERATSTFKTGLWPERALIPL